MVNVASPQNRPSMPVSFQSGITDGSESDSVASCNPQYFSTALSTFPWHLLIAELARVPYPMPSEHICPFVWKDGHERKHIDAYHAGCHELDPLIDVSHRCVALIAKGMFKIRNCRKMGDTVAYLRVHLLLRDTASRGFKIHMTGNYGE